MNTVAIRYIAGAFSMKGVVRLIAWIIGFICVLPLLFVVLLTQIGINVVSNSIATSNQQTSAVEIRDPVNNSIVATITDPRVWPVSGPVTLEFGESDLPYQPFHTGIDIAAPGRKIGEPVGAFMKGTVVKVRSVSWGYGNYVVVDNGNNITSLYAHLDSISVTESQPVEMGTVVGTRGTTGWSTGPHLHFEVRVYGLPVNPRTFLEGNP